MKALKLSAAFAAVTLAASVCSQAWALDAFWHGVRSTDWGHGIVGGTSNWYSKAPPSGAARNVPDGTATFAAGPLRTLVDITANRAISKMHFTANAPGYSFRFNNNMNLTVNGDGLLQDSNVEQTFVVGGGILRFINSAEIVTNAKPPPLFQASANGSVQFRNSSKGGPAIAELSSDGELTFFDNASADKMNVLLIHRASAAFLHRSNAGSATFKTQNNSELRFDLSTGPGGRRQLTAGQITNNSTVKLGINTLRVQRTYTQGNGVLAITATRARVGKMIANRVNLGGNLTVTGSANMTRGQYVLIQSNLRAGQFASTSFASFPAGMSRRIKYVGNNVVLVLQ